MMPFTPRGARVPPSLPIAQSQTYALRRGWLQWAWCVVGFAALLALPALLSPFWVHVVNLAMIATVGAIGLNLLTGTARLVSLGQAAFLGIGGFTAGLMTLNHEPPFPIVLLAAALAGGLVGLVVALPSLRLRVLYVAVTTLVLHFGVNLVLNIVQGIVRDTSGLIVPRARIGGFEFSSPLRWYYFLLIIDLVVVLIALNLLRSFVGRRWVAVADHDVAAEALGVSVPGAKLSAFVVTSAIVAFAGALQGYYLGTVTYEFYELELAITYLAMIIVGGVGRILGSVLGAVAITLAPYAVDAAMNRLGIGVGGSTLTGLHNVVFGALIIGFLLFEPRGLAEVWRRVKVAAADWPFRFRAAQRSTR